jgi:hypothetical protein
MSDPGMIGRDFPQLWWLSQQSAPVWGGLCGRPHMDPELSRWMRNGWVAEATCGTGFVLTQLGATAVSAHSRTPAGIQAIAAARPTYKRRA